MTLQKMILTDLSDHYTVQGSESENESNDEYFIRVKFKEDVKKLLCNSSTSDDYDDD